MVEPTRLFVALMFVGFTRLTACRGVRAGASERSHDQALLVRGVRQLHIPLLSGLRPGRCPLFGSN